MWSANGNSISMVEGEYGVGLPMSVSGVQFSSNDELKLTVKRPRSGVVVLEKTYANIAHDTITLTLTEEESNGLPVGRYVYSLAWYQDGMFLAYLIERATFEVVRSA